MKVLYIIGNGFDLNLGLKTSYRDFYDFYKSIDSSSTSINDLKKSISENYKNWADLELALGQYTEEFNTLDEFDEVFEDIGEKLAEYLKMEESKFSSGKVNTKKFFDNLLKPEVFLPQAETNKIIEVKNKFYNQSWYIDIVTFNYTRIIEKITGDNKNINLGNHPRNGGVVNLRTIEHIHGYTDDRMVLGVNDITQLKKKEFHQNIDVLEAIVKEKCNTAYGHAIDNHFKTKIRQADFICIFGASIGDTDNMWWELIGKRLKVESIPIIIFTKGEEVISPRISYKNNRTKRKMRNYFLKKTKLTNEEIQKIEQDIFIALDSSMFKDIIKI